MSTTQIPDSLRERLLKTPALAEHGVGGERANADAILDKLLRKHGLTRADLVENSVDRETHWYAVQPDDREIFRGVVERMFGEKRTLWSRRGKPKVQGVDVSPAELIALQLAWEEYERAWHKVQRDTMVAFLAKHRLFDEEAARRRQAAREESSPEARADAMRRRAMMDTMDHVQTPIKRLTGSATK